MNAPNPAAARAGASDALWSFLWGKRRSRRQVIELEAQLRGTHGTTTARTVDVSRHGALLQVAEADLAALHVAGGHEGLLAASDALGEGFELVFAAGVAVAARLVRLYWRPGDTTHVFLGCEFDRPMERAVLGRLGLSHRLCLPETGVGTPPAEQMEHVADPRRPLALTVLDEREQPMYAGPLVGLEGSAIATHLAPADPTSVVARLSGRPHTVCIVPPGCGSWASPAYLLAVRLLDGRDDAVEVVLTATVKPPRAVVRAMRRRRATPSRGAARS